MVVSFCLSYLHRQTSVLRYFTISPSSALSMTKYFDPETYCVSRSGKTRIHHEDVTGDYCPLCGLRKPSSNSNSIVDLTDSSPIKPSTSEPTPSSRTSQSIPIRSPPSVTHSVPTSASVSSTAIARSAMHIPVNLQYGAGNAGRNASKTQAKGDSKTPAFIHFSIGLARFEYDGEDPIGWSAAAKVWSRTEYNRTLTSADLHQSLFEFLTNAVHHTSEWLPWLFPDRPGHWFLSHNVPNGKANPTEVEQWQDEVYLTDAVYKMRPFITSKNHKVGIALCWKPNPPSPLAEDPTPVSIIKAERKVKAEPKIKKEKIKTEPKIKAEPKTKAKIPKAPSTAAKRRGSNSIESNNPIKRSTPAQLDGVEEGPADLDNDSDLTDLPSEFFAD
jgi:hypothetical protein